MEGDKFVRTTCKICRKECGMLAHVKEGKILALYGDPENQLSKGALCAKAASALEFEYDSNRLIYPMMRIGERGEGKWRRITWDEAFTYIAEKLNNIKQKYGSEAISLHTGCEGDNSFNLDRRFCDAAGFANFSSGWGVCYGAQTAAFRYTFGGGLTDTSSPFDFWKNSNLFLIWNTKAPNSHPGWLGVPDSIFTKNVKTIVIDPLFTPIASKADMWVPVRINTDLALALAMINVIIEEVLYDKEFVENWTVGFDKLTDHVRKYTPDWAEKITDVSAEQTKVIARKYATTKPATICYNASCHHTQYFQFARAFSILMAITGNIVKDGAAKVMRLRKPIIATGMISFADARLGLHEKRQEIEIGKEFPAAYHIIKEQMILDGPWQKKFYEGKDKALICDAINFLIRKPNYHKTLQAIKNLELLVCYDVYMNETSKYADIVLPSTTFLESDGFSLRNWHNGGELQVRQKVVEPPGECKSNFDLFKGLAERMGLGEYFPWKDVREMIDYIIEPTGVTFEELQKEGFARIGEPLEEKAYEKEGFLTPSKKIEIYSSSLERMGINALPTWRDELCFQPTTEFPLLFSSYTPTRQHSWTLWPSVLKLEEILEEDCAYLHRDVAERLEIRDGDLIVVETKNGNAKYKARITEFIHPNSVIVSRGLHQEAKLIDLCDPVDPDSSFMGARGILCRVRKEI